MKSFSIHQEKPEYLKTGLLLIGQGRINAKLCTKYSKRSARELTLVDYIGISKKLPNHVYLILRVLASPNVGYHATMGYVGQRDLSSSEKAFHAITNISSKGILPSKFRDRKLGYAKENPFPA